MNKERVIKVLFMVVGLINFVPLAGVLGDDILISAYAVEIASADMSLLLRHRAAMFGIIGGLLLIAAFRPTLRPVATWCGFASMISFAILYLMTGSENVKLTQVLSFDIAAIGMLLAASLLNRGTLSDMPADRREMP